MAMRDITDQAVLATALLTYRDEQASHPLALAEANRMLDQSVSYFKANHGRVLKAVAGEQSPDLDFARWQAARQRPVFGESGRRIERGLASLWSVATTLGDLTEAPDVEAVLFDPQAGQPEARSGLRRTVSIAVLDDATRRGALYAIEQGFVRSRFVDLSISYLSASGLAEALSAREYDVVEGSAMEVPKAKSGRLDLLVLSGGVEDLDSTLLYVRNASD
jgi:hypothetical protein